MIPKLRGLLTPLLTCLLLTACHFAPEYRADVPLLWGMRWDDEAIPAQEVEADCRALRQIGADALMIEFLMAPDSAGLPRLLLPDSAEWPALRGPLESGGFRLSVSLNHGTRHPLFTHPAPPDLWLARLEQEISQRLLPRLAGLPLERLCLGTDFRPLEPYAQDWGRTIGRLRAELATRFHQPVKLTYAAAAERLEKASFWSWCDEIGLIYPPRQERQPSDLRRLHRLADSVCREHDRPLFVAQANLIGPDKTTQIEQRLSFWPDSLRHKGLTLNTLFHRSIWSDSSHYYGAANDTAFRAWIRKRINGG